MMVTAASSVVNSQPLNAVVRFARHRAFDLHLIHFVLCFFKEHTEQYTEWLAVQRELSGWSIQSLALQDGVNNMTTERY